VELSNSLELSVPIDRAWEILRDVEGIAPCVPGFELEGQEDGVYRGAMKVRVGAVTVRYRCDIRFIELDDDAYRAVVRIDGTELRGQGAVAAETVSTLIERDGHAQADIKTSLNVSGRVAQFGRGIMGDVSNRLVEEFVRCLEQRIAAGSQDEAISHPVGETSIGQSRSVASGSRADAIDLLEVTRGPVLKRLWPLAVAAAVVLLVLLLTRRR
jgi:carbon monoxide dehydrogenase subunit G